MRTSKVNPEEGFQIEFGLSYDVSYVDSVCMCELVVVLPAINVGRNLNPLLLCQDTEVLGEKLISDVGRKYRDGYRMISEMIVGKDWDQLDERVMDTIDGIQDALQRVLDKNKALLKDKPDSTIIMRRLR